MSLLELAGVDVAYGDLPALSSVDLVVEPGETLSVVGANGAGKTTMLRTISGLLRPRRGEIRFAGERIDRWPCHRVVEAGVVHVPEGRKVFPSLAVRESGAGDMMSCVLLALLSTIWPAGYAAAARRWSDTAQAASADV